MGEGGVETTTSQEHDASNSRTDVPSSSAESNGSTTSFRFVLSDPTQPNQHIPEPGQAVDRFAHTRTKRKRTSQADLAVLDEEYARESRPDKNSRNEIVKSVSMTEKEVQIWFQNRRQQTRRKCKTWHPNEISDIIRSSKDSSTRSSVPRWSWPGPQIRSTTTGTPPSSPPTSSQEIHAVPCPDLCQNSPHTGEKEVGETGTNDQGEENALQRQAEEVIRVQETSASDISRKELSLSTDGNEAMPRIEVEDVHEDAAPLPLVDSRRTASAIRLSMSLDGKASLILDNKSPSPPSKKTMPGPWPRRTSLLKRSQSAISPSVTPDTKISQFTPSPWSRPGAVGRSRDARAWEFFCDTDTRDELTIAAEHEKNGSAQGALGLIRSNSGRLSSNLGISSSRLPINRQNSATANSVHTVSLSQDNGKRKSGEGFPGQNRPKLARTASSVARMQTTVRGPQRSFTEEKTLSEVDGKGGKTIEIWEEPGGDSDKENWEPGTQSNRPEYGHSRHHLHVLGEHGVDKHGQMTATNEHTTALGVIEHGAARFNRQQKSSSGQEMGSVIDRDVQSFMKGPGSTSLAAEDELDAVHILSSLSRGRA